MADMAAPKTGTGPNAAIPGSWGAFVASVSPGSAFHPVGETLGILAIIGSWLTFLPHLTALLAAVWYVILIIESRTAKRIRAKFSRKPEDPQHLIGDE